MTDHLKIWEKLKRMPGGDRSPFEIPFGPTEECLSIGRLVSFIEGGENNPDIIQHLANCQSCRDWLARDKALSQK